MELLEHPDISAIVRTGWPDGEEPREWPKCPVCGADCEEVYVDSRGVVVGCDGCLRLRDAWTFDECFEN